MLGFHSISVAAISALNNIASQVVNVVEQTSGGWKERKKRWSVKTGLGYVYFDSLEAAMAFYENPYPKNKKKAKRVKKLGGVSVQYESKPLTEIPINNNNAFDLVLNEPDRMAIVESLIINALVRQREEEEFLILIALTQ